MNHNKPAQVFHFDLYGKRETKYDFLNQNSLASIDWNTLNPEKPNFFFVKKDFDLINQNNSFQINSLFEFHNSGLTTEFDELAIQNTKEESKILLQNLQNRQSDEIEKIYHLGQDKIPKIDNAIRDIRANSVKLQAIYYRPFDKKYTIYTGKSNGIMGRPRNDLMKHFFENNLGLVIGRQGQAVGNMPWNVLTITNTIVDCNVFYRGRGTVFPLYLYPEKAAKSEEMQGQLLFAAEPEASYQARTPNLNPEIVAKIAEQLGMRFSNEKQISPDGRNDNLTFAPIDILDYIYAVLHSPSYREKYKEFLKIDFPRVPYPSPLTPDGGTKSIQEKFWKLVALGSELRQIHLLESPIVEKYITQYPIEGDNKVGKIHFEPTTPQLGRVYLNYDKKNAPTPSGRAGEGLQCFTGVPQVAWNFYIGGYQPAQKWLKDRKERILEFDDILHYQKIIVALSETDRLMTEINAIDIE